ncbi:hypothetical protein ES702_06357 [subsurface metagenome]
MAWYDTVKSWFTPESTTPEYWEFETPPEVKAQPVDYSALEYWEFETPPVIYPKPEYWEFETPPVVEDSLWDKLKSGFQTVYQEAKEIAPDVGSFYAQIQGIKRPVDTTSLVTRQPTPMEIPRTDFVINTPYQRPTSGTQPGSKVTTPSLKAGAPGAQVGLSMPLILVGAGLIFFMLRKR